MDNKEPIFHLIELEKIKIKDYEVSQIIVRAILAQGYDITIKPVFNNEGLGIGEEIVIYRRKYVTY